MLPRISIITPSYQQQAYLAECLLSVREQNYPALEHIVVDGGSVDGSREVIQRYADGLVWWCSEADRGQSHAINKGLGHATGQVFAWLNSDDLLLPGALQVVGETFAADPSLVLLEGHRFLQRPNGERERAPRNDPSYPDRLLIAPVVNQQATFYRMDAVRSVGGVDEALHYCMDLDLWWRVLFAYGHKHFSSIVADLALFRLQPESKTAHGAADFVVETAAVLHAMAEATEQMDLADLLVSGYPKMASVRPSNATTAHAALVRRMVYHFIVKWNASIGQEVQFRMLKRMHALVGDHLELFEAEMLDRWKRLRVGLSAPDWTLYRAGRKLGMWSA